MLDQVVGVWYYDLWMERTRPGSMGVDQGGRGQVPQNME